MRITLCVFPYGVLSICRLLCVSLFLYSRMLLVALKGIPRALFVIYSGRVIVYCVLRPFRGSLARFIRKDDRLYLLVLFCSFSGFKTLEAIKRPPRLFDGFFY